MPFAIALPIASKSGQGFADSSLSTSSFTDISIEYGVIDATVMSSEFEEFTVSNVLEDSTVSTSEFTDFDVAGSFEDSTVSTSSFTEQTIPFVFEDSTVSGSSFDEVDLFSTLEDSTVSGSAIETFDMPGNFADSTVSASDFVDYNIFNRFEDSSVSGSSLETDDAPNIIESTTVSASSFEEFDIFNTFEDSTVQSLEAIEFEGPGDFSDSTVSGSSFEGFTAPNTFEDSTVSGGSFEAYDAPNTFADSTILAPFGTGFEIDEDTIAYIDAVTAAGDTVLDSAIAPLDGLITTIKSAGLKLNTLLLLTFTDRGNGAGTSTAAPSFVPIYNRVPYTVTGFNFTEVNRITQGLQGTGTEYVRLGIPLSDLSATNYTIAYQGVYPNLASDSGYTLSYERTSNARIQWRRTGATAGTTVQTTYTAPTATGQIVETVTSGAAISVGQIFTANTSGGIPQADYYRNGTFIQSSAHTLNYTSDWAASTDAGLWLTLGARRNSAGTLSNYSRNTHQVILVLDVKLDSAQVATIANAISTFTTATSV